MAQQKFFEGQRFGDPNDPTKPVLVYRGGKFYPEAQDPMAGKTDPNAPVAALPPGSEARTRLAAGLGPSIAAQQRLYQVEGWHPDAPNPMDRLGHNPLDANPVAVAVDQAHDADEKRDVRWTFAAGLARSRAGQDYQDYTQAAKSFESAFMPILSGAAVTPSEATRMIRANLPELGDTPITLARKAKNRAMMINAAADLMGRPRPFQQVGIMPGLQPRQGPPQPAAQPQPATSGQGWKVLSVE